jgi:hypothetical protein
MIGTAAGGGKLRLLLIGDCGLMIAERVMLNAEWGEVRRSLQLTTDNGQMTMDKLTKPR